MSTSKKTIRLAGETFEVDPGPALAIVVADLVMALRLVQETYAQHGIEPNEIARAIARGEAAIRPAADDPRQGALPIAAPLQLRTYDVTWRQPAWGYAYDEIEATSPEDALKKAKAKDLIDVHFEFDTDSTEAIDWISVEGDDDHAEWSGPSLDVMTQALDRIVTLTDAMYYEGTSALNEIRTIALGALDDTRNP